MTEKRLGIYTFLVALLGAIAIMMVLASCDPIKRAMKRQDRLNAAINDYLRKNPPRTDTVFMPGDTIYHTDTLVYENIYVDTIRINDTVYIVKERVRSIKQRLTIRDTVLQRVTDCPEFHSLRQENVTMHDKLDKAKKRIKDLSIGIWAIIGMMVLLLTGMALRK